MCCFVPLTCVKICHVLIIILRDLIGTTCATRPKPPRLVPSIYGEMRYKLVSTTMAIPTTVSTMVAMIPLVLLEHREHEDPWSAM